MFYVIDFPMFSYGSRVARTAVLCYNRTAFELLGVLILDVIRLTGCVCTLHNAVTA